MPIASDTPHADENLHPTFYEKTHDGVLKTFMRLPIPGDQTTIWDQPVRECDKERFPRHWLFYQMKNSKDEIFGTPLSQWAKDCEEDTGLGNQIAQLSILKFQSVEQVASMTDTQVQKVGMGAAGLRERARGYLSSKNVVQSGVDAEKLNRAEQELSFLKTQMAALVEQMNNRPPEPERRGPGRPRKVVENVEHDAPTGDAGNQ